MVTVRGKNILNTTCSGILIRMDKPKEVTSGGIIIPATVKKETDFIGYVAVTSKTDTVNRVGDKVIVRKHTGYTIETDDTENIYKMYNRNTDVLWNLDVNPIKDVQQGTV